MKQNNILTKRQDQLFAAQAVSVVFAALSLLIMLFYRADIPWQALIWMGAVAAIMTANLLLMWFRLMRPLHILRGELQAFADTPDIHILKTSEYSVCPEWEQVISRVNEVMDRRADLADALRQSGYLALQNQINPHFIYNTLEAIRGDALYAGLSTIADTTEALASFFRYIITDPASVLSLEDELYNVESYFVIQKYRFGDKIKMIINIPDADVLVTKCKLPKLTLQPIVENAIHHGLEAKIEGGTITISIETTEKKLLIRIRDNGVGMALDKLEELNGQLAYLDMTFDHEVTGHNGGIALRNVNSRIKLLYGQEYGMHVYSTPGIGTDVDVVLPLMR